ncbi:MAG: hypothetical protein HYZ75_04170 [Elusimicrobia bacterium]|nr:hypothetical protein [Elusimicrobiota bacterium]
MYLDRAWLSAGSACLFFLVLLLATADAAGAYRTKDGGAEVTAPPGWTVERALTGENVFEMAKGASMFSLALAEGQSGLGAACARLKTERASLAKLGKAPKPISMFQGKGRSGCFFSVAGRGGDTLQGYIVGPRTSYSFILNNGSNETLGQIFNGFAFLGKGGPSRSTAANAVIAALPKEDWRLGPLSGRFLGTTAGYALTPVEGDGLLVKGHGVKIHIDGRGLGPPGPARDRRESDFLNAKAPGSVVDGSRCKSRGMMPVSKDAWGWMFRLFDCPGGTDILILGTLTAGETLLTAQGRAADERALKALRLWAETAELDAR